MSVIDLDKGVMVSRNEKVAGGMYVYMYLDTPGDYLTEHGTPVPQSVAKAVGFDTAKFAKDKAKRKALAEFKSQLEIEMELSVDDVTKILVQGGGYKVISLSHQRANVVDEDGNVLNPTPLDEVDALSLFDSLTAPEDDGTVEAPKPAKKG